MTPSLSLPKSLSVLNLGQQAAIFKRLSELKKAASPVNAIRSLNPTNISDNRLVNYPINPRLRLTKKIDKRPVRRSDRTGMSLTSIWLNC